MSYHTPAYYHQQAKKTSGTAKRDQFGNLIDGESSGIDQNGQPIPLGLRPREQGLHTGSMSQPGATGPDAFDRKFGRTEAPPMRAVTTAPAPAVQPVARAVAPAVTQVKPLALAGAAAVSAPAAATPTATPAPVVTPSPAAATTKMVAAPDAFGATRTNMNGGTERWQPSETARNMGGSGKWVGGGISPQQVALPANPDDRALLMQTRARDAAARQPAPVSIPGGDPAARAWNTAHGTGHASTPEPGAPALAAPVMNNNPDPRALAAAGTGQVLHTAYGDVSSTIAKRPDAFAKAAPAAAPAAPAPVQAPAPMATPAAPAPVVTRVNPPAAPSAPMTATSAGLAVTQAVKSAPGVIDRNVATPMLNAGGAVTNFVAGAMGRQTPLVPSATPAPVNTTSGAWPNFDQLRQQSQEHAPIAITAPQPRDAFADPRVIGAPSLPSQPSTLSGSTIRPEAAAGSTASSLLSTPPPADPEEAARRRARAIAGRPADAYAG